MLTKRQFQILASCSYDEEIFYMLFWSVNDREDDRNYEITVPAKDIIIDIVFLIQNGYLNCLIRDNNGTLINEITADVSIEEFSIYENYDCLSFGDHIDKYGYGPHVFRESQLAIEEINKDIYSQYRIESGWL